MLTNGSAGYVKVLRRAAVVLALAWIAAWIAAEGLIVKAELPRADALVVLAGSSTFVERTHHAAQLFHAGRAPRIILTNDRLKSGWSIEQQRNPLFVERAVAELESLGVPSEKIEILPDAATNTYDEAVSLRRFSLERGLRSLLVVTSAYQARRVLWTMRRIFNGSDTVIGLDVVAPGEQCPRPAIWWWNTLGWKLIPGEYIKLFYYRLRY
jgi:uncharacterized SAM-binding protein YcdF (DUF218 family)